MRDPPTTGTNKIVKRTLVHQKWRSDRVDGDPVFIRGRGEGEYREFDGTAEETLRRSFATSERERYWDL